MNSFLEQAGISLPLPSPPPLKACTTTALLGALCFQPCGIGSWSQVFHMLDSCSPTVLHFKIECSLLCFFVRWFHCIVEVCLKRRSLLPQCHHCWDSRCPQLPCLAENKTNKQKTLVNKSYSTFRIISHFHIVLNNFLVLSLYLLFKSVYTSAYSHYTVWKGKTCKCTDLSSFFVSQKEGPGSVLELRKDWLPAKQSSRAGWSSSY